MSGRSASAASGARRGLAAALLLITLVVGTLSLGAGAPPPPARRLAYAAIFPAGPGQAIAERACLLCHSPMLVTQQAKDSTGWEKTLVQMESWGAPMTPAEHDSLRIYLLTHFGPRPLSN